MGNSVETGGPMVSASCLIMWTAGGTFAPPSVGLKTFSQQLCCVSSPWQWIFTPFFVPIWVWLYKELHWEKETTFCWPIFHLGKFLSPGHCSADGAVAVGKARWGLLGLLRLRDISSKHQRVQFHIRFGWLTSSSVSSKIGQAHPWLPGPDCYCVPPRLVGQVASWTCSQETDPCSEKWGTDCRGLGNWEGCPTFCASLQVDQLNMT